MMFKNSVKLLISNFSTVWKILLFKVIVVAITIGLFCATFGYLATIPSVNELTNAFLSFLNGYNFSSTPIGILSSLFGVCGLVIDCIIEMATIMPWMLVYLGVLFCIIFPYLWHLADVAVGETLYGYMSSQTKYKFSTALISKLNLASGYSFFFSLFILPFNLIFIGGTYAILYLTTLGGLLSYFTPFLFLVFAWLYLSLRTTLVSGWVPAIIVYNCHIFSALKKGFKALFRRFFRVWSTNIAITFCFLAFIMFLGSIGILALTPVLCYMIVISSMVMFFGSQGMRYYVDMEKIITPKKLEQTDTYNKYKYIV